VSAWITHWAQHGVQSLHDQPRSGRPSILRPEERDIALHSLKAEPHALKRVRKRFADTTDKRLSLSSRKRLATKAHLRWKRVRTSRKSLRDPDAFAQAKRDLAGLQHQEDHGQLALYYCDASGFALDPTIP
jgi:transposase